MAHHLAELMRAAEEAETEEDRVRARRTAEETILRIWTHRAVLPGGADPLARHRDLIRALAALKPDAVASNDYSLLQWRPDYAAADEPEFSRDRSEKRLWS
ncbi:hypothetical protein [Salinarimonas ramus]|uniref:Uncharacterized protein n=1 Tax=Salinarimonas ramus TaxID=690164 RepID=A0A917Q5M8_9HYPH|nr:hypothetical protein [Salinarimonas ramus]GGK27887.1 hypothetical protein GCM10011322_13030 [Salinarimonas ramus]